MKAKAYFFLSIFSVIILFSACDDDDNDRRKPGDNTNTANEWIYQQMKGLYLWNVRSDPNFEQEPDAFFKSLLYKRGQMDGDRFSNIEEILDNKRKSALSTEKLGFDFTMMSYFKDENQENSNLGFFVLNVRENTNVGDKGLKRGNVIYAVNGTAIDYSNYQDIRYYLESANSISSLSFYDENGQEKTISDLQGNFSGDAGNPIWMSKVIEAGIGYIVYNEFERGDNYQYDIDLVKTVKNLVDDGVENMIIDLRYNPGGYVLSATHLASALVPNRSANDIFVKFAYNSARHDSLTRIYGDTEKFLDKVYSTGQAIPKTNLKSLYILTSENTASASEALISGLTPYMGTKLKQVGLITMGKDKGSWTVEDSRFSWKLHPLIMRVLNKNNNSEYGGNYENGIEPSSGLAVDELSEGYKLQKAKDGDGNIVYCPLITPWQGGLVELGNKEEPLLATAIADIKGERRKSILSRSNLTKTVSVKVPIIKNPRKPRMIVEPRISE